jgi:ABC-type amino acid transport system permease subunit
VFDVYLIVALFYLLVNIPLNILVRSFERRWQIRRI